MARPQGSKNKVPLEIRKAFSLLVERRVDKLEAWLDEIAATDPAKAFSLFLDLAHYVLPKLKSVEYREAEPFPPLVVRFTDGTGKVVTPGQEHTVRFLDEENTKPTNQTCTDT